VLDDSLTNLRGGSSTTLCSVGKRIVVISVIAVESKISQCDYSLNVRDMILFTIQATDWTLFII
jgi:hypothetical protein